MKTLTTSCDCCGSIAENAVDRGWGAITVDIRLPTPPGSPPYSKRTELDICPDCFDTVRAWENEPWSLRLTPDLLREPLVQHPEIELAARTVPEEVQLAVQEAMQGEIIPKPEPDWEEMVGRFKDDIEGCHNLQQMDEILVLYESEAGGSLQIPNRSMFLMEQAICEKLATLQEPVQEWDEELHRKELDRLVLALKTATRPTDMERAYVALKMFLLQHAVPRDDQNAIFKLYERRRGLLVNAVD